jgi:hypothetical protein
VSVLALRGFVFVFSRYTDFKVCRRSALCPCFNSYVRVSVCVLFSLCFTPSLRVIFLVASCFISGSA